MPRFDRTEEKTRHAQSLRNDMPSAERKLWRRLQRKQLHGFKFRRQHPTGPYILDIYCPELKLCIELDGEQHGFPKQLQQDAIRTKFLEDRGVCVLRFWNHEIFENVEGVLETILERALYLQLETKVERGEVPSP